MVSIGDEVVISSKALIEGNVIIKERAFIGIGASIGEECRIESYGVVAAGGVLPKATIV
jgi:carbonic anhydrase/acetyltransferase-like protein (isoleucine patch superfamily)